MFSFAKDYLDLIRFFKPGGTLLIFLPHAWGLTMAAYAQGLPFKSYIEWLLRFLAWSFSARSLGCTINDMCDYKYDREVERTKARPIASGRVSLLSAGLFSSLQLFIFLALMWTNDRAQMSYRLMCLPFVLMQSEPRMFLYPVMKRLTTLPQAWLGIAMNWGSVIAWVSICGGLNLGVISPLMCGLWAWTMYYDTIYACQDYNDDLRIGIGSSAITMRGALYPFLCLCAAMFVIFLEVAIIVNKHSVAFCIAAGVLMTVEMASQLEKLDPFDGRTCKANLARNSVVGCILLSGMMIDYIYASFQQHSV